MTEVLDQFEDVLESQLSSLRTSILSEHRRIVSATCEETAASSEAPEDGTSTRTKSLRPTSALKNRRSETPEPAGRIALKKSRSEIPNSSLPNNAQKMDSSPIRHSVSFWSGKDSANAATRFKNRFPLRPEKVVEDPEIQSDEESVRSGDTQQTQQSSATVGSHAIQIPRSDLISHPEQDLQAKVDHGQRNSGLHYKASERKLPDYLVRKSASKLDAPGGSSSFLRTPSVSSVGLSALLPVPDQSTVCSRRSSAATMATQGTMDVRNSMFSVFSVGEQDADSDDGNQRPVARVMSHNPSNDSEEEEYEQQEHYWMRPAWYDQVRHRSPEKLRMFTASLLRTGYIFDDAVRDQTMLGRCLGSLVMKPDETKRLAWDITGFYCFAYDAIMIPLAFFHLPEDGFYRVMEWIVRMYWTLDIFMAFITGNKNNDGAIDLRIKHIAKKYITSWFLFDLTLVSIDWSELLGGFDEFSIARMGKLGKSIRMVRMVRVLRLARNLKRMAFVKWLQEHLLTQNKDYLTITFGVTKVMMLTAWVTHFMGCCWYGLTANNGPGETSWVDEQSMLVNSDDTGHLYAASFMWALSQFTGQSNIYPVNFAETVFSIITLLFTFVVSIYAVSSITTLMTQLQMASDKNTLQFSLLRQYLVHNSISKSLAMRVQSNVFHALTEAQRNTPEESVELLSLVSHPLRIELHYEVNAPLLTGHPFFLNFDDSYRPALQQICHNCVSRAALEVGDILFSGGEMTEIPFMYFLETGKATYLKGSASHVKNLNPGDWASEASLWTAWSHVGVFRVTGRASIVRLEAMHFQRITCQFLSSDADPRKYGKEFVAFLNKLPRWLHTDLVLDGFEARDAAERCMPSTQAKNSVASFVAVNTNTASQMISRLSHIGLSSIRASKFAEGSSKVKPQEDSDQSGFRSERTTRTSLGSSGTTQDMPGSHVVDMCKFSAW